MGRKITFRPLLPEIEVEELDLAGLDRLAWLLREERQSFRGLSLQHGHSTKLRGDQILVLSQDPRTPDEIIAKVGNYLLESQNGTRYISSDIGVSWGDFQSIPMELLVPCEGDQIFPPTQL